MARAKNKYTKFENEFWKNKNPMITPLWKMLEAWDNNIAYDELIKICEYVRVASKCTPDMRTKDLVDEYFSIKESYKE